MDDDLTPHGRLIEEARGSLSKRAAAQLAGISEGRWRQIVTGVQKAGGGVEIPVNPRPETLVAMAEAVGADVGRVLEAAGLRAPAPRPLPASRGPLSAVPNADLINEVAQRLERTSETGAYNAAPTKPAVSAAATTEAINAVLERPREQLRRDLELAAKRSGSRPETRVLEVRDILNRYMSEADAALASLFVQDRVEDGAEAG